MSADKRDECGCHHGCTMLPHECAVPCRWPSCLTEAEQQALADEVLADDWVTLFLAGLDRAGDWGPEPVPIQGPWLPSTSVWTSPDEWRDPNCVECEGEGAPCCEPPDHPYSTEVPT